MELGKNFDVCIFVYIFFFIKIWVDEGICYYYIIVCVGCIFYFGVMLFVFSFIVWFFFERFLGLVGDRWSEVVYVDMLM